MGREKLLIMTTRPEPVDHRLAIELALCQRDYDLMAEHHPDLLDRIEAAVVAGATPAEIKRWTMATVSEPGVVQRVYNAGRWVASGAG